MASKNLKSLQGVKKLTETNEVSQLPRKGENSRWDKYKQEESKKGL